MTVGNNGHAGAYTLPDHRSCLSHHPNCHNTSQDLYMVRSAPILSALALSAADV